MGAYRCPGPNPVRVPQRTLRQGWLPAAVGSLAAALLPRELVMKNKWSMMADQKDVCNFCLHTSFDRPS